MAVRILICFPIGDVPGLRSEAAQLAFGLASNGHEVIALGQLGTWRHPLRLAGITAVEFALPGDESKLLRTLQEYEPQVMHAFGAEAAHLILPLTMLVGAGGVATLGHGDLSRVNPNHFRTASAVCVPCEFLREQLARRLPNVPVVTTGCLLPPPAAPVSAGQRFRAEELGLRDDAPVVLLADHFHGSAAEAALALISATPLIAQHVPGVQVVVAGNGMRLGELESQAIEVNNRLGYRAVLLPGFRDDIHELLALTTIAVGSGRFAQEALGAGVALVAAGASGMIGTYTEESAQLARFSCCGYHGHLERVTPKALASEIIGLFQYPQHRAHFATEAQRTVMAEAERALRAEQIAAYYTHTAPTGTITRTPQCITAIMPDDLRELLFALPAISGLRMEFPLAKVSLVAAIPHVKLLQQLHVAERVLPRPRKSKEWLTLVRELTRPRPDVCLPFNSTLANTLLAAFTRAPHRVGFSEGGGSLLLSDHLHARLPASPARALTLVQALGVARGGPISHPGMPLEIQETVNLSLLAVGIGYDEPIILCCPQAAETRAWPAEYWRGLLHLLVRERHERLVVLDAEGLTLPDGVIPVEPVRDSLMLAALLTRASTVVAPDNGPLHLADILGVPTIGLYGPTSPDACCLPNAQRAPRCHREYPCQPCQENVCAERHCLRAITPAEVARAVAEILHPAPAEHEVEETVNAMIEAP